MSEQVEQQTAQATLADKMNPDLIPPPK